MAVSSGQLAVSTTAVEISAPHPNAARIHIHNDDVTSDIYIGGANVTTANGLRLTKLDSLELELAPSERLYAIVATGTVNLSWLRQNY